MKLLYIIDYYTADGISGDCYPDYCNSREEAERIAPLFMRECAWAAGWKIRTVEDEDEGDHGEA
jgi:hypothetical protein